MNKKIIKIVPIGIGAILLMGFVYFYFFQSPLVKKSISNICHEKGTLFYENTKNFTPYINIKDCLESGGRLPKK
jgi:hypothetical protein